MGLKSAVDDATAPDPRIPIIMISERRHRSSAIFETRMAYELSESHDGLLNEDVACINKVFPEEH